MIIANHHALEVRFGCRVELVISAEIDFEDSCIGMAKLAKDHKWLLFIPVWLNLSEDLIGET